MADGQIVPIYLPWRRLLPLYNGKIVSPSLASSFLIGSSSNFLITRTGIKSHTIWIQAGSDQSFQSYVPLSADYIFNRLMESPRSVGQSWSNFICSISEGKAVFRFGVDSIKTVVAMATESINGRNHVSMLSPSFLIWFLSNLQIKISVVRFLLILDHWLWSYVSFSPQLMACMRLGCCINDETGKHFSL